MGSRFDLLIKSPQVEALNETGYQPNRIICRNQLIEIHHLPADLIACWPRHANRSRPLLSPLSIR
jgi:hypothetical protein